MGWIHQLVVNVHILSWNVFFVVTVFYVRKQKKHSEIGKGGLADSTCEPGTTKKKKHTLESYVIYLHPWNLR